jgi:hypothetical protein
VYLPADFIAGGRSDSLPMLEFFFFWLQLIYFDRDLGPSTSAPLFDVSVDEQVLTFLTFVLLQSRSLSKLL